MTLKKQHARACSHPGCGAKLMAASPHACCQRHRPRHPHKHIRTEEEKLRSRERAARRRALAGLPAGWEGA